MWIQMRSMIERIQLIILIVVPGVMTGDLGLAYAVDAPQSQNQQQIIVHPPPDFSGNRVWLIAALIALMAILFFVVFWWQQKIEQSGYFANMYREAVEKDHFDRHALPIRNRWYQGAYGDELLSGGSERANKWRSEPENRMPGMEQLQPLAQEVDVMLGGWRFQNRLYDFQAFMRNSLYRVSPPEGGHWVEGGGANPFGGELTFGGTQTGTLMPGMAAGDSGTQAIMPGHEPSRVPDLAAKQKDFESKFEGLKVEAKRWTNRARECMGKWYAEDLKRVKDAAQESAELALGNIDFSAVRGRGPEFVLEFTAIVVIIFAAVILGIGSVLDSNQIGTLLAAIAGYVLGKAVSRGPSGSAQVQLPQVPVAPIQETTKSG